MRYVGISLGHDTDRDAEHWLRSIDLPDGTEACTHLARAPYPHVAVSLAIPDGVDFSLPPAPDEHAAAAAERAEATAAAAETAEAAADAAAAHAARRSGRAVVFAGAAALTGTVTVADVLAKTAIERVTVLGGGDADPSTPLDTRDFVRPQWTEGVLTLVTMPAAGGRLVPFEVPDPTPCCADH